MSKGTKAIATIVGRMGSDVQVRTTQAGKKVGSIRLAVTSGFGENELTSWLDVVIFDEKKVEIVEKYTSKGSRIMVIGELRVRKWTDKDGNDRYATETVVSFDGSVELMDSKADSPARPAASSRKPPARNPIPAFDTDLDDDVPF